ncbi:hypothetical protein ACFL5G_02900 [Candidatus Margulisiibacteriota bacterium]
MINATAIKASLVFLFVFLMGGSVFAQDVTADVNVTKSVAVTENKVATADAGPAIPEMNYTPSNIQNPFYFVYKGSNTNFTIDSQSLLSKKYYTVNYNRFRTDIETGWQNKFTFNMILDLNNYWGDSYMRSPDWQLSKAVSFNMPLDPYHDIVSGNSSTLRSYLYRAYATVYLPSSSLVLGYQRIAFGVGKIWNPTDILNPPNPISLEPGERVGVYGASYTYNLADLSQTDLFLTLDRDNKTRDYGFRIKGNHFGYDAAISTIRNKDLRMSGLELDRELFDTGIEVRMEAAHFEVVNKLNENKDYQKYIMGADYAFAWPNNWYVTMEYLFNENGEKNKYEYDLLNAVSGTTWDGLGQRYLGFLVNYEWSPLINITASEIVNLDDGSYFLSPGVNWSLAENADLILGASFFCGTQYSEFWYLKDIYYLNLGIYF